MKTRKKAAKESKHHGLTIRIPLPKSAKENHVEAVKKTILGFRTKSEQFFIDNNQIKPLKTSLLMDSEQLPPGMTNIDPTQLEQIYSHRPIAKIKQLSGNHSPVTAETPRGSTLYRTARFGALSLFSNQPELEPIIDVKPIAKISEKADFFASDNYEYVKEAETNEKIQSTIITLKQLEARRAEDIDKNFKRSISQNKIMANPGVSERKASATDYVNATQLFRNDLRWEWLHLVAHMILGKDSQKSANLVAATAYSNTEMMFAENGLNYLARVYPTGFNLTVKATLIPSTQIATVIHYIIKTPDFELCFDFNTQTRNQPHINYAKYFDFMLEELVRCSQLAAKKSKRSLNKMGIVFFSKKQLQKNKLPQATKENIIKKCNHTDESKKPNRVVVIDTETTGLHVSKDKNHTGDRVVEIGGVELLNDKPTGKEFRHIINPERSIPSMLKSKGIHNITNKVVKDKPTFREIADEFCDFIKNAQLVGHNLPFDITMLENELRLANRPETLVGRYAIDTLKEARDLLPKEHNPNLRSHKLSDLCDFYDIDTSTRADYHGALIDARLTSQLFKKLKESTLSKQQHRTNHSLRK